MRYFRSSLGAMVLGLLLGLFLILLGSAYQSHLDGGEAPPEITTTSSPQSVLFDAGVYDVKVDSIDVDWDDPGVQVISFKDPDGNPCVLVSDRRGDKQIGWALSCDYYDKDR